MKIRLLTACLALASMMFFAVSCTSSKTTSKVNEFNLGDGPMGTVSFEAQNSRYKAFGTFKDWRFSNFSMTGNDISSIDATIEVSINSIEEKSPKLTAHLKAPDFFDAEKHSAGSIRIKDVNSVGGNAYKGTAIVTLKGMETETPVEFDVTNTNPLRVQGSFAINREFFKLGEENKGITADVPVNFDTALPVSK